MKDCSPQVSREVVTIRDVRSIAYKLCFSTSHSVFDFRQRCPLWADALQRLDRCILPANVEWQREVEADRYPMPPLDRVKERAKAEGLWTLFLPGLREDEPGTRLSNLEYAPLVAEMMGRLPWCSEVFNCSAPVRVPISNLVGEGRHSTSNASIVGALRQ